MALNECKNRSCPVFTNAKRFLIAKDQTILDKLDMEHLHQNHVRIWGEIAWTLLAAKDDEVKKLSLTIASQEIELKKSKSTLAPKPTNQRTKNNPAAPTNTSASLSVDPCNHVDKVCDALVKIDGLVYKCTEYNRYQQITCSAHANHTQLVKKDEGPAKKGDEPIEKDNSSAKKIM
jgi:hypothetical protein